MESSPPSLQRVQAQELLSRFRSKEDLYRYMVQQGKYTTTFQRSTLVGLFLPSMDGCKISFMKAILSDDKKALKSKDVHPIEIPNYPEISVKNLYDDAMNDPQVSQYLPSKKQVSNKLPER